MEPESYYREYWAYLRHAESLRFQLVGVVTAVGAAVIGVGVSGGTRVTLLSLLILLALGLFIGFVGCYLVAHKKSYDRYAGFMRDLEPPGQNKERDPFWCDAFTWLLAMMTVLELLVGSMGYVLAANNRCAVEAWQWAGASVTALVCLSFVAGWWAWYWTTCCRADRLSQSEEPGRGSGAGESSPAG